MKKIRLTMNFTFDLSDDLESIGRNLTQLGEAIEAATEALRAVGEVEISQLTEGSSDDFLKGKER